MTAHKLLTIREHEANILEGKAVGWSPEELALLRQLWTAGLALAEIARRLGRSAEAVRSRARRLRLAPRRWRRRGLAVPALAGSERACLCCTAEFVSEGPHNRLCDTCRASADGDYRVAL